MSCLLLHLIDSDRHRTVLFLVFGAQRFNPTMDRNYTLKNKELFKRKDCVLLLVLLTGFQQVLSTRGENLQSDAEKLQAVIQGPDYVTVGVPSSVECVSECMTCTYSMSLDGQAAQGQGNALAFTVNAYMENLTVSCSVTNTLGQSATAAKKLQVLVGPVNVSISSTDLLNSLVSHTFSCHARCLPSCFYSWRMDTGPWISGEGNVVSVTPREMDHSKILVCKATNTVSGMFAAAIQNIVGPTDVEIEGPDVIELGEKTKFVCMTDCPLHFICGHSMDHQRKHRGDRSTSTCVEVTSAVLFLAAILNVLSIL